MTRTFPDSLPAHFLRVPAKAENPDKVFLTFMCHPTAGKPVEYAVRALCGTTCTNARCELVSLTPISGSTTLILRILGQWCYGNGAIQFSKSGKTQLKANVFITNPWTTVILQDEIDLTILEPQTIRDPEPPGAAIEDDDKVYLRFLDFPKAKEPVRWAVRAKIGNFNKGADGKISASIPISGNTEFGLINPLGLDWAHNEGNLTFAHPGPVDVVLHVTVRTGTGSVVNLQHKQAIHVGGVRSEGTDWPIMADSIERGDWQVEFKLMGFPHVGVPIDWSVRGMLGNMVKDVQCEISAAQALKGQTTSFMIQKPFGEWYGSGRVIFRAAGTTEVMASIFMIQYGNAIILSRRFSIEILSQRESDSSVQDADTAFQSDSVQTNDTSPRSNIPQPVEIESSRPGGNALMPSSRHLLVRYHSQYGNPAKFRLKAEFEPGHSGEKVAIVDYNGDPNLPINQFILKGDGEQELLVPYQMVQGMLWGIVEFHWISGNARVIWIHW